MTLFVKCFTDELSEIWMVIYIHIEREREREREREICGVAVGSSRFGVLLFLVDYLIYLDASCMMYHYL